MLDVQRIQQHEEAAHEKRNWIRLTAQCNNRCTFCLDSDAHNGTNVSALTVKSQIIDGRKKGATRLILSGGEPTIHPNYVEFITLGRRLQYRRIQTVTNGRMFSYKPFLTRCIDAGLQECTFSVHGPNAKVHDALVGVRGAFEQEIQGIVNALEDGRAIVNIDIVINKMNVKHLTQMMDMFIEIGVREFDLLQIIPFGRAYHEGLASLFYDFEEHAEYIQAALAYSKRPDLHVWVNRMPPPYMEGYETLIQDPYKLNDEVRGRQEEYEALLAHGTPLSCKDPERCRRCYLEKLCGTLDRTIEGLAEQAFPTFRTDKAIAAPFAAKRAWVRARTFAEAPAIAAALPGHELVLECDDYTGLAADVVDGADAVVLAGKRLVRAEAKTPRAIDQLMAVGGDFEVAVYLTQETCAHLLERYQPAPARMVLTVENYERVTDNHAQDPYLPAFFAAFDAAAAATENIPACLSGRAPRPRPSVFDSRMLGERSDGRIDIFGYAKRYIEESYYTKSRRCRECVHDLSCEGVHINFIRAHGYAPLRPVDDADDDARPAAAAV
jgi:MoaA/NifB/PqqE/SkfB family radical SAM enzyme